MRVHRSLLTSRRGRLQNPIGRMSVIARLLLFYRFYCCYSLFYVDVKATRSSSQLSTPTLSLREIVKNYRRADRCGGDDAGEGDLNGNYSGLIRCRKSSNT